MTASSRHAITAIGADRNPNRIDAPLRREAVVPTRSRRSWNRRLSSQAMNRVSSQPVKMVRSSTPSVGGPKPMGRKPTETVWPRTELPGACSSAPPTATASSSTDAPGSSLTEPATATTLPVT